MENKSLGRFAVEVANALRGKNKPTFVPYKDMGDTVFIKNIDAKRILIVVDIVDANLALASRNIPYVEIVEAVNLNPVLLVSADKVIATPAALKQLEERLA